ncbi:DUF58 domain-containing protein [Alienimonas californiensis]|uniref:DUF58 domain-containing protein n=1 Tax=Alienimonas californiensis TaxID=2527989 RepID=A0A517P6M6_9PLAN|nr:DUF58 domain-containing protein [Alienimonas californiensis]QDT15025.1 hypothetical protein CA12_11050 [Alienimonas californiensis]
MPFAPPADGGALPGVVGPRRAVACLTRLLHHDFCPGQNGWAYKLKHPLWAVAAATVAAALVGVSLNAAALWVAAALAVGGAAGVVWPWVAARGLRCTIEFDGRRGREGTPATVVLRVTNRLPLPAWGLSVAEGFGSKEHADGASGNGSADLTLDRVPGWATVEYRWTFTPTRRGVLPLAPPRLATAFPFGLWSAAIPAEVTRRLVVWPRGPAAGDVPEADAPHPSDDRLSDRDPGEFGDLLGTRAFREGDSLRRVHWAQTARHRRLIVCERQAGRTATVRLRADLAASSFVEFGTKPAEAEEAVEAAVRVVAGLCESLVRLGATVECRLNGATHRLGGDPAALRSLLDALAAVPRGGYAAPPDAGRTGGGGLGGVVVTGPSGVEERGERVVRVGGRRSSDAEAAPPCSRRSAAWVTVVPGQESRFAADWRRACRAA